MVPVNPLRQSDFDLPKFWQRIKEWKSTHQKFTTGWVLKVFARHEMVRYMYVLLAISVVRPID